SRTTSPRTSPISSANEPGFTSCTSTPLPGGTFSLSATSGVNGRTVTPSLLCFGAASSPPSSSPSPRREANSLPRSATLTAASRARAVVCVLVAHEPQLPLRAGLPRGTLPPQLFPVFRRLATDGDGGAAIFRAGATGRPPRHHIGNRDPRLHSIHARNRRILL